MPKNRIKKKNYQLYDDTSLDKALQAVRNNEMSQRKASQAFGVPQATISDHIRGKVSDGAVPGRAPVIPRKVEAVITEKVTKAAEMGMGMSKLQVMQNVGKVVRQLKLKTPFKKNVPGKDWWKGFKKRNDSITLRSPEKLTSIRARGLNQSSVGSYFFDLYQILEDNSLTNKPHHIWNMDEKGVSMEHNPVKVVASKSARNIPGRVANTRTSNTIISCINAAGVSMPPLIIVKGKTEKSLRGYNMKEGPVGSKWTYQQNAWTEDILGVEWFKGVFLAACGEGRPQLLLLDGHHSHETLGLIELARENDIILLCLPPHTTHYLCPLDRTVFGPLSREYNKLCSDYLSSNPANTVDKISWPSLFNQAYNRSFNPSNIISGFRSCGIVPLNPLSLPIEAFAPSMTYSEDVDTENHPLAWVVKKIADARSCNEHGVNIAETCSTVSTSITTENQTLESNTPAETSSDPLISGASTDEQPDDFRILHEITLNTSIEGVIDLPLSFTEELETLENLQTSQDWDFSVNSIFQMPSPPPFKKAKKNTSHRLLTADEVFLKKKTDEEEKKAKLAMQIARKEKRALKTMAKAKT